MVFVKSVPDLLTKKRHDGRKQPQRSLKDGNQGGQRRMRRSSRPGEVETQFDDLQVPVAEIAPEEAVERVGRLVEAVFAQSPVDLAGGAKQPRDNPDAFEFLLSVILVRPPLAEEGSDR